MGETILIDMKELSNLVLTPRAGNLAEIYWFRNGSSMGFGEVIFIARHLVLLSSGMACHSLIQSFYSF